MDSHLCFELIRQLTVGLGWASLLIIMMIKVQPDWVEQRTVAKQGVSALVSITFLTVPALLLLLIAAHTGGFAGASTDTMLWVLP